MAIALAIRVMNNPSGFSAVDLKRAVIALYFLLISVFLMLVIDYQITSIPEVEQAFLNNRAENILKILYISQKTTRDQSINPGKRFYFPERWLGIGCEQIIKFRN